MSSLPDLAIRNESQLQLTAWVYSGTDIDVTVDWSDGTATSISCVDASELNVVIVNYTYETAGTFTVSVAASNRVSGFTLNQAIVVYERITNLTISGDSSVQTPPGTGTWEVEEVVTPSGTGRWKVEEVITPSGTGT